MNNFISKLLYSLKSEKSKRREMEKAFRSETDSEPLPLSFGENIIVWFGNHWKWLITTIVAILLAIFFKR